MFIGLHTAINGGIVSWHIMLNGFGFWRRCVILLFVFLNIYLEFFYNLVVMYGYINRYNIGREPFFQYNGCVPSRKIPS